MKKMLSCNIVLLLCVVLSFAQPEPNRREQYLKEQLKINDPRDHRAETSLRVTFQDSTWSDWQKRTGELPPDFSKIPSCYDLPDPLLLNGKPIATIAEWEQKKEWIRKEYQYWISGQRPSAPVKVKPVVIEERYENEVHVQTVEVKFGPEYKGKITCELLIPPGEGPFPVYMTQWTHRNWAQLALRRGYMACIYAAADGHDDTQDYQSLYPEYDFSCLMRRAWGASRVVDYLYTRTDVDKSKIAITGHSRNGKQSLWAAAFDERITAVVTSSCGTGGITPFRYSDPSFCSQTLDDIASKSAHWFHPRLRFFFGREDKLPVDQNLLLSLIAPRPLLMHYSIVERQLNPWGNEQCFHSVQKVYQFLNAEDNVGIFPRMGEHAVAARDVERCIDFLDIHFGRRTIPWQNKTFYNYDFNEWKANQGATVRSDEVHPVYLSGDDNLQEFEKQKQEVRKNISWLLGKEPPGISPKEVAESPDSRVDWIDLITHRPVVENCRLLKLGPYTAPGDHLQAYLYCPLKSGESKKIPVVIFLHQYSYAHGFALGYSSNNSGNNSELFQSLVDNGFAVMAIDMLGFGTRIEEGSLFYERFSEWSKMGKMVADVRACVDAVETFDFLDPTKIFLLGNSIGGTVALLSASLDQRVAGVAVVSGFTPWRSKAYPSGISMLCHLHGLVPKLGLWADDTESVPVDFPEILASIAPRPLMVIAPELDRHTNLSAIKETILSVSKIYSLYGQKENLQFDMPLEINRLTNEMKDEIIWFFKKQL